MSPTLPEQTADGAGSRALNDALQVSLRALRYAMGFLLLLYLASGVFVVRQHEKAFVLLLGQVSGLGADRVKGPGLHWTLPRPFAEVVALPAERIQTLATRSFWYHEAGGLQEDSAAPPPGATLNPDTDGCNLTGDANLLHSRWAVRYTIQDPEAYLFGHLAAPAVLSNEVDRAVTAAAARFTVDGALRTEIDTLRAAVEAELRDRCGQLGLGLKVQGVDLLAVAPPRQVMEAFNAVLDAESERARSISEARAYETRTRNEAQGEAARVVEEGRTFSQGLVASIRADADYFDRVLPKYEQSPQVIRRTLLQDTLRRTLARVDQKYVLHSGAAGQQELRLLLSPEQKRAPGAAGRK